METIEQRRARNTKNTRNWRMRHPDRVKKQRSQVYQRRKTRALEMIGGAFCVQCGCDELSYLEINHIEGGGAKEWRSHKCSITDKLLSGKRSTNGLNVMCRVCNAIDFLIRKNPNANGKFVARWEKYTGKRAVLIKE